MPVSWPVESAIRDLQTLAASNLSSGELRRAFLRRLSRLIPFDSAWFAMADPGTLLFTDAVREEIPAAATSRFIDNEFLLDDFNKWTTLVRTDGNASSLDLATGGRLRSSYRYREILEPLGFGDELRAAMVADGVCWGFLCLHRASSDASYSREDVDRLGVLAPVMAVGLRRSLVRDACRAGTDEIGVILVDSSREVIGMSVLAEQWLAEISDADWPSLNELPPVVAGAAANLSSARLKTISGVWLSVQAVQLAGQAMDQTAIMIGPARPIEVAPLIMQAFSFTARETEIVGWVLRGFATKEMAAGLRISELTVQQHLKAVFEKTGVRTRRELTAQVFLGHYQPRIRAGTPLGPAGHFIR